MASFMTHRSEPPSDGVGRILVVEDERVIALDLTATLSELGYEVIGTAATGEDAIRKARNLEPNLVLMDIRLAGAVDGVQAAEAIKRERDIPIIYLTAHSDAETLRRAKNTEPRAFLVKPFRVPELRCAIEIALHRHEIDARLKGRAQWLAETLRSTDVVPPGSGETIELRNPVAKAFSEWTHQATIRQALDEILSHVSKRATAGSTPNFPPSIPQDAGWPRNWTKEAFDAELDRRVVERTAELEAATAELEAFNYSVAHDLRAPLRGIDSFSQELLEEHAANLGAEGVDQLRRVRSGAERMGQIIDDLLRLARANKSDLRKRHVNLSRLARIISIELEMAHPARDVELVIQEHVSVEADEQLLRIMLQNLIGNAWKFTAKVERPRIEIGQIEKDGVNVGFVRDNGAGFDMHCANKLFVAFQRLHSSRDFEGTGIGLAIVRRIVSRHGGRIWAESAVGQGACFYFII